VGIIQTRTAENGQWPTQATYWHNATTTATNVPSHHNRGKVVPLYVMKT